MSRRFVLACLLVALAAPAARAQFASSEVSPPGTPTPFRVTKTGWSWEDLGGCVTYSVHRSTQPSTGFSCILDGQPTASWTGDTTPFGANSVFYYLVTGFDGTTDNSPGTWSDGTARDIGVGCVRTPLCASTPVPGPYTLRLVRFNNTNFASPLYLTSPPGDPRIFVLERAGRIQVVQPDGTRTLFLDFHLLVPSVGSEKGALGLAFHPNYACNGLFYVSYSGARTGACGPDNCGTIAEYHVSSDPDVADPASARVIIQQQDDAGNHNGGWLGFGKDGKLYWSIGDGGAQGDPNGRGQNLGTWYAKILRLDIDGRDTGLQYAVPPDNPFVGFAGALPEIWCYGMRNPWRPSFDRETGDLYVADVGQGTWEEVTVLEADPNGMNPGRGANLGWKIIKGLSCYSPPTGCDPIGLTLPAHVYQHAAIPPDDPGGCSISGGFVYRGCHMPDLRGTYFFADYCSGWIDSFEYVRGTGETNYQRLAITGNSPVSFGEDGSGEIYVINQGGSIYRIDP